MTRRNISMLLALVAFVIVFRSCSQDVGNADNCRYMLGSKSETQFGTFQVTSDILVVSDPGYDIETVELGSGAMLRNPLKGRWRAHAVIAHFSSPSFSIVADLVVHHESVELTDLSWEKGAGLVGVDAGMMGVYDLNRFHDHSVVPKDMRWTFGNGKNQPAIPEDLWYSMCCELTLSGTSGGVFTGGVVTTSGKGDGGYEYFLSRSSDGHVVGVKVHFVDDDGGG
jgi:hypothetical protein